MHDISEVRSGKHTRVFSEYINIFNARKTLTMGTMCADAFWKNYAASQEWQKKHNITWWRSRCVALEYENEVLRNKLRSLAQQHNHYNTTTQNDNYHEDDNVEQEEVESHSNTEEFEFNITEDMLKFFETSERHRRELQEKRKYFKKKEMPQRETEDISVVGGAEIMSTKKKEAESLYGNDGPKILAMETAIQATLERHKDLVNPQYWPNIPLKF